MKTFPSKRSTTPEKDKGRRFASRAVAAATLVGVALSVGISPARAQDAVTDKAEAKDQLTTVSTADVVAAPATTQILIAMTGVVHDDNNVAINNGKAVTAYATCSGFFVSADGYLVTAGHCVQEARGQVAVLSRAIDIELESGNWTVDGAPVTRDDMITYAARHWSVSVEETVRVHLPAAAGSSVPGAVNGGINARIVESRDPDEGDVALLKIQATNLPVLELGDDADVRVGTEVVSIGYASASEAVSDPGSPSFEAGRISSRRTAQDGKLPVLETSASLNSGMSGGPTVDSAGRVVGVNSYQYRKDNGFNYVQPVSLVRELVRRNGVDNELSAGDKALRDGVAALNRNDAAAAEASLGVVLEQWPDLPGIKELRQEAADAAPAPAERTQAAVITPELVSSRSASATPTDEPGSQLPALPIGLAVAGVALTVLLAGAFVWLAQAKAPVRYGVVPESAPTGQAASPAAPTGGAGPQGSGAAGLPVYC